MMPPRQTANAGYLPDYQYEIIVGFDPEDDQPFNGACWVTQFTQDLRTRVTQLLEAGRARIWNCDQMRGHQQVVPTTLEAIEHSAAMVAVVTPRYLADQNPYRAHAKQFAQALPSSGGATRLFNVYKLSCKDFGQEALRGYKFWDEVGPDEEMELMFLDLKRHYQAINALAHDIRNTLRQLRRLREDRPQVYLAPPAAQLTIQYQTLREGLHAYCRVVPVPGDLPMDSLAKFTEAADSLLAGSRLSIHMLGAEDDPPPPGFAGTTPSRVQFDLACARASMRQLECVVWCAENPLDAAVGAQSFIRSILIQQNLPTTIDKLMPGNLVELQARVRGRLKVGTAAARSLYLVRHLQDAGAVKTLEDELRNSGYSVQTADGDYQASTFIENHTSYLRDSSAGIICAGNAPMDWLRFIDYTVRVHLGQNPGSDLDRFVVYLGPDKTPEKEGFFTPLEAIRDYDGFTKAHLDGFLSRL